MVSKADYDALKGQFDEFKAQLEDLRAKNEVDPSEQAEVDKLYAAYQQQAQQVAQQGADADPVMKRIDELNAKFDQLMAHEMRRQAESQIQRINEDMRSKYEDWATHEKFIWSEVARKYPNANAEEALKIARAMKTPEAKRTEQDTKIVQKAQQAEKEAKSAASEKPSGAGALATRTPATIAEALHETWDKLANK